MTNPSIRGISTGTDSSGGNPTVFQVSFTPAAPQSGDLLVAFCFATSTDTADGVSWPGGASTGWTAAVTGNDLFTALLAGSCRIYTRTATGSESDYVFAPAGFPKLTVIRVYAIQNAVAIDGSVPAILSSTSGSVTQDAPSVTTALDGSILLCGWAAAYTTILAGQTWTPPGDITEDRDNSLTNTQVQTTTIGHKTATTAGATGTKTNTVSRAAPVFTYGASIALRAALIVPVSGYGAGSDVEYGNPVTTRPVSGSVEDAEVGYGTPVTRMPDIGISNVIGLGYGDPFLKASAGGTSLNNSVGHATLVPVFSVDAAGINSPVLYGDPTPHLAASAESASQPVSYGDPTVVSSETGITAAIFVGHGDPAVSSSESGIVVGLPVGYGYPVAVESETGVSINPTIGYGVAYKVPQISGYLSTTLVGHGVAYKVPQIGGRAHASSVGYGQPVVIHFPMNIVEVIQYLLGCITDRLVSDGISIPGRVCMVPGHAAWDDCECGQLTASIVKNSSSNQFPNSTLIYSPCDHPLVVWQVSFLILRCMPTGEDDDAPTCDQLASSALGQYNDSRSVKSAILCCLNELTVRDPITGVKDVMQFAAGDQVWVGPQGACGGSEITVFIGLASRCDC